jgi:hypothetical protein
LRTHIGLGSLEAPLWCRLSRKRVGVAVYKYGYRARASAARLATPGARARRCKKTPQALAQWRRKLLARRAARRFVSVKTCALAYLYMSAALCALRCGSGDIRTPPADLHTAARLAAAVSVTALGRRSFENACWPAFPQDACAARACATDGSECGGACAASAACLLLKCVCVCVQSHRWHGCSVYSSLLRLRAERAQR